MIGEKSSRGSLWYLSIKGTRHKEKGQFGTGEIEHNTVKR